MRIYNATRFIFPKGYSLRVFTVCFVAAAMPVAGFAVVEVLRGEWQWPIFWALLAATGLGAGLGILGLHGLLEPLRLASRDLERLEQGKLVKDVPEGGPDLAGKLLYAVARAARETAARMHQMRADGGTDMLTGLLNRRGFEETVAAVLRGGGGGTVAILDFDRSRKAGGGAVAAGDEGILCALAQTIVATMRPCDVAGRWDSDEFAIFFPGLGEAAANEIMARIRDAVSAQAEPSRTGEGAPIAWATVPVESHRGDTLDGALRAADQKLYGDTERRRAA